MTCQDSFHEVAFNISFWTRNISSARILFWRGVNNLQLQEKKEQPIGANCKNPYKVYHDNANITDACKIYQERLQNKELNPHYSKVKSTFDKAITPVHWRSELNSRPGHNTFLAPTQFKNHIILYWFFVLRTIWRPFVSSDRGMMPPPHYATAPVRFLAHLIKPKCNGKKLS